ncbi:hypothetical protein D049_4558A, partial [Vibrio parahaemolyticus VPTS-2010]
MRMSMMMTIKV